MEAARGILLVLATVFIAAECLVPIFKRVPIPATPPSHYRSSCHHAFVACTESVLHNPLVAALARDPRTLAANVDEVCQLYHEPADCVRRSLDDCPYHIRQQTEIWLSVGDFVCSNRGRSLLTDVQDSACYTEEATLRAVAMSISTCAHEASPASNRPRNECQVMLNIQQCASPVITQECGEAAGELATEILDRLVTGYQHECPNDIPQESLKRSLLGFFR